MLLLILPSAAFADPSDEPVINVTIPNLVILDVHGAPLNWNATGINGLKWFKDGHTNSKTVVCRVWANCNWILKVQGVNDYFSKPDGSPSTKPREDIVWHNSGPAGDQFAPLTEEPVEVHNNGPGNYGDNPDDFGIDATFEVLMHWSTDKKGTYNYTVHFTLSPA